MLEHSLDALFRQPPAFQLLEFVLDGWIDFGAGVLDPGKWLGNWG